MSDPFKVEEVPPGVPGRIYICEWCGHYYNNFVPYGEMNFCPKCNKKMLRKDCGKCGAPIPFPPQFKCFQCGEWLTLMPMVEVEEGHFVHSGDVVKEPDAEHRKQLEVKGNNWMDVVKGKAEGPDPELPDVPPPTGWSPEEFARLMSQANIDIGESLIPSHKVWCDHCKIKLRYVGNFTLDQVVCSVCQGPVTPLDEPELPPESQTLDNGTPTG